MADQQTQDIPQSPALDPNANVDPLTGQSDLNAQPIMRADNSDYGQDYKYIFNKDGMVYSHVLYGATAATAANYSVFFNAPFKCTLIQTPVSWTTAGTDGAAVTLQLEKLTGTTAPGAGTSIWSATVNLKGTANTVTYPKFTSTKTVWTLARGDRLALVLAGTPTALANVCITVSLKPYGQGHYRNQ